jgi:hypothetical protein
MRRQRRPAACFEHTGMRFAREADDAGHRCFSPTRNPSCLQDFGDEKPGGLD